MQYSDRYYDISTFEDRKKVEEYARFFLDVPDKENNLVRCYNDKGSRGLAYNKENLLNYNKSELDDYINLMRDLLKIEVTYSRVSVKAYIFTARDVVIIVTLLVLEMILFIMLHKSDIGEQDTFIFNVFQKELARAKDTNDLYWLASKCYELLPKRTILVTKKIWKDVRYELDLISRKLMVVVKDNGEIFRNIMLKSKSLAYLNYFIKEKFKTEENHEMLHIWQHNFPDFVASNAVAENKQLPPVIENKLMAYLRADDSLLTDPYYIANFYIETKSSEHLDEMAKAIDDMAIGSNACVIT